MHTLLPTRSHLGLLVGVAMLILLTTLPFISNEMWLTIGIRLLIAAFFATGYNLCFGYMGTLSLAHGAFFGVGAYTVAFLCAKTSWPFFVVLAPAPVAAAGFALIVGYFSFRLGSLFFALLTLAFGQLFWILIWKAYNITGGEYGLLIGEYIPDALKSSTGLYYFVLTAVIISIFIIRKIVDSPFGRTLLAIRENEERVEFLGVNVKRCQLIAFVISGFFSGLAGALLTIFSLAAFPDYAHWIKSVEPVMACLLGGIHVFVGPAIGAAIMLLLEHLVLNVTVHWQLVLGGIVLLVIFFLPDGVVGFLAERLPVKKKLGQ